MAHSFADIDTEKTTTHYHDVRSSEPLRSPGFNDERNPAGSILIVVHQLHSTPGEVGRILSEWGYDLDVRCLAEGDRLPKTMDQHEGAIVLGGPMSANDDDTLPFIKSELDWIPTVVEANKPYLGICLGAQLLARSLGAPVAPHPQARVEVGYYPLHATAEGQSLFNTLSHVYHWHKEGFELPTGAQLLATGDAFPNQAFQYGNRAYGFQFHPEITLQMITKWTTDATDHLLRPGAQAHEHHFQSHERHAADMSRWLARFLNQWLHHDEPVLARNQ